MNPLRLLDRLRRDSRRAPPKTLSLASPEGQLSVRRVESISEGFPWTAEVLAGENGVPRNAIFLEFSFGYALKEYHAGYIVYLKETPVGYFVLAAQADRFPLLAAQIVDCDALLGCEAVVLWAASRTGLRCADLVRLRIMSRRFVRVFESVSGARVGTPDVPFRILPPRNDVGEKCRSLDWRITYGDHDEYRNYPYSQRWRMEKKH